MAEIPPVIEPKKSFTLSAACLVGWAVGAVLLTGLALLRAPSPSAFEFGEITGQAVGLLILPTIIAWLAWRVSGRSARARTVAFFVVLVMGVFGQVATIGRSAQARAKLAALDEQSKKDREQMRQKLARGEGVGLEQQSKLVDKTVSGFKDMAENSTGRDRELALAMQAFGEKAQACQKRYTTASAGLNLEHFFDFATLAAEPDRATRRTALQEFQEANNQMRSLVTDGASWLQAELKKRGLGEKTIRDTMTGYEQGTAKRGPLLLQLRDTDDRLIKTLGEFVDLAEALEGQWHKDGATGKLTLPTDEAVAKYNGLLKSVNAIGAEQVEIQKKIFAL